MMHRGTLSRIATLGCIGYLPGSGTIASLCMLPLIYLINYLAVSLYLQAIFIALFAFASFLLINHILLLFTAHDPSEIVIDECVGMLIAVYALPETWFSILLAFLLFRVLDISKLFGIKLFERLPGAWGILLDDIAAAVVTNVLLRFLVPLACN